MKTTFNEKAVRGRDIPDFEEDFDDYDFEAMDFDDGLRLDDDFDALDYAFGEVDLDEDFDDDFDDW